MLFQRVAVESLGDDVNRLMERTASILNREEETDRKPFIRKAGLSNFKLHKLNDCPSQDKYSSTFFFCSGIIYSLL